jgi:hypothetical protein
MITFKTFRFFFIFNIIILYKPMYHCIEGFLNVCFATFLNNYFFSHDNEPFERSSSCLINSYNS